MNLEFLYVYLDYFILLNRREFWFEILLPIIVCTLLWMPIGFNLDEIQVQSSIDNSVIILSVLIGFASATIAILTGSSNEKVVELKNLLSTKLIGGKPVSLYRSLLVNLVYAAISSIILLAMNVLCDALLDSNLNLSCSFMFYTNIVVLLHIFAVSIKNLASLYFIHYRDQPLKN